MKILVLSDTHIPVTGKKIPHRILKEIKNCDLCIHAGDFIEYPVFEKISSCVKTVGVCGNMDSQEIRQKLPLKTILKVENVSIGIIHGKGVSDKLISFVDKEFENDKDNIDVFIFGHSHNPLIKTIKNKLYFNPGSAMDKIFTAYNSYGILEITGNDIKPVIVKWDHLEES